MTERKAVPPEERVRVSGIVRQLLELRGEDGKRTWTQAKLGDAIGVSQESVRRALTPDGVVAAVRDGLKKYLDEVGKGPPIEIRQVRSIDSAERFGHGRAVAAAIAEELGIPLKEARSIVGQVAFDEGQEWSTELDLYRLAMRAARSQQSGGALGVGERALKPKKS